jgi:hypothetical protein
MVGGWGSKYKDPGGLSCGLATLIGLAEAVGVELACHPATVGQLNPGGMSIWKSEFYSMKI